MTRIKTLAGVGMVMLAVIVIALSIGGALAESPPELLPTMTAPSPYPGPYPGPAACVASPYPGPYPAPGCMSYFPAVLNVEAYP